VSFQITEEALAHIKSIIKEDQRLRIAVAGGGCSGLSYNMSFESMGEDTRPGDMALISPDDKVLIIIDGKSALFLDEVTLHYNGGLNGKGFEFNNPKAKTTCGCGSSFGV